MKRVAFPVPLVLVALCAPAARAAEGSPPAPAPALVAVRPFWLHAFASPARSRDAIGIAAEHAFGRSGRVAVGVSGAWYAPLDAGYPLAPLAGPVSEISWEAAIETRVWIARGETWEVFAAGGPGAIWTRPVSLVDPERRAFSFTPSLALGTGVGALVRVAPMLRVAIDARDLLYAQRVENPAVADVDASDEATWYGGSRISQIVAARLGLAVEVP